MSVSSSLAGRDGPRVVAVGGGHGLAATLAALRRYAGAVTAVVTAADDGGSSGRLRAEFAMTPPGDVRRCLAALAPADTLLARALEHRFVEGDLAGHPVGNLLLAGLAEAGGGGFQAAVDELARLLGACGRVTSATVTPVELWAETDGGIARGESAISQQEGIKRVWVTPADATPSPVAVEAIASADQVVLGPGSLFTSVLAAAVSPGVWGALAETRAEKVLVANLAPEHPMTVKLRLDDHVEVLAAHGIEVDVVVVDEQVDDTLSNAVEVRAPLRAHDRLVHDPELLALALAQLPWERRSG
ncbi:MAG: uridine diphosphate-N-acetylglucosamine-binding protein YvcK [Acidimicrobiales bacterium]